MDEHWGNYTLCKIRLPQKVKRCIDLFQMVPRINYTDRQESSDCEELVRQSYMNLTFDRHRISVWSNERCLEMERDNDTKEVEIT